MCIPSTTSRAEALREQLQCPVALAPLYEAVSIVPCAHKVQEVVARYIFGEVQEGWKVRSRIPCPVCRVPVIGYMVDHLTRSIARQVFEPSDKELHAMLAMVKKSESLRGDLIAYVPYPGKPAQFVADGGDWKLFPQGGIQRSMEFTSCTEGSLLQKFSIFVYRDRDVKIYMCFSKCTEGLQEYLKNFGIILTLSDQKTKTYMSKNHDQLRRIFSMIAINNQLPDFYFGEIRKIIVSGRY